MAKEIELSVDNVRALASLQQFAQDEELREVVSFDDAMQLAEQLNETVMTISEELGSGFALLEDKGKLSKTKFVIIQWRFSSGDFGTFVSAAVVTTNGDKYIINDGSAGIMDQLLQLSQKHKRFGGLVVDNGLRVSNYDTCAECGKPRSKDEAVCGNEKCQDETERRGKGQTFYLDTSAPADRLAAAK